MTLILMLHIARGQQMHLLVGLSDRENEHGKVVKLNEIGFRYAIIAVCSPFLFRALQIIIVHERVRKPERIAIVYDRARKPKRLRGVVDGVPVLLIG